MEKVTIYNSDLHFEHKQWNSELAFWKDELKSFNLRLNELVNRWTKKEVLQKLEHYQNEFTLHKGVIEKLQEEIQIHETSIAAQESTGRPALDTILVKNHSDFRKKMEEQRQIYADLKKEFFRFLSQHM
ncbi:hypothetical protein [Flagellimonas halotolerans]|uniref:Uncharacterized protein n=1 Tax=Flagellimonas halotolerans TaxID=3112164 RepID=A0ABU6IPP6_9FLAO|nr:MULTISPECIES: hypothetical protein [unclassified Allomuricauda]MEC3965156.1 hypothetical protein [Muricauda sp. SYSU M86414]MEC4264999.1 hypothetical protein [Muricauda sp. SYSU M84420]